MATDRSRAKTFSLQREATKDKKEPTKVANTMSLQSKTQRHVITNNTTADDVSWIVHLRDVKKDGSKLVPTSHQVFAFGDTKTEATSQPKLSCDYKMSENTGHVDHLLRKKKCDETPNWSQGYFETGLRGYYKENEKVRLRQLEKNFRNIPAKPKADEYPEFLVEYKKEKVIRKELKTKVQELSSVHESTARVGLIRKLPKLHYSALDGRHKNLQYKEVEDMKKCKRNINQTYHLISHEGHLPTVAWESSLRERPTKSVKPKEEKSDSVLKSGR